MRTSVSPSILGAVVFSLALVCCAPSLERPDAASLSKNSFEWNPSEIEVGLANWDTVYPAKREVPRGAKVHELSSGVPLAAFSHGGIKEESLEQFMLKQKVAGIIVIQDGEIRLERYAQGFSKTGRWTSESVAKSVTSTLVGAAIKDGFISSIDDSVAKYIPDLKGSVYDKVSIRQLLTMTTGVRWNEDYTDPNSDIARFYTDPVEPGMNETVSYMRRLPAEAEPGAKWVYKTGETHLLGVLVSSATKETLADYLSKKIWGSYGMEQSATWTLGRSDNELAGCCLQASLRDYARYGQFVLEGGLINGESIVPDGWFEAATHTQVPLGGGLGYGYQWWTSDDGQFRASGIYGQVIYIDPARRLVVAINSAWPEAWSDKRNSTNSDFLHSIGTALDEERTETMNKEK